MLQKNCIPSVLWLTGLSGAGKTTIALGVQKHLIGSGAQVCILDGDELRKGLCKDLGFSNADRAENIRRTAEIARLMVDAGMVVLVALISPFRAERVNAASTIGTSRFYEIHIDTALEVAERRDVKGLYKNARAGRLTNFTGIDSPYEIPESPALTITTTHETVEQSVAQMVHFLKAKGVM